MGLAIAQSMLRPAELARRVGSAKLADRPAEGRTRSAGLCAPCSPPTGGEPLRGNGGYASLCRYIGLARVAAIIVASAAPAFAGGPPTDAEILALMKTHCVRCHAAEPTHEAFAKAPAGVLLETIPQIAANAARIMNQVVVNRAMPLGNETGMTDEERDRIAAWIEGRRK